MKKDETMTLSYMSGEGKQGLHFSTPDHTLSIHMGSGSYSDNQHNGPAFAYRDSTLRTKDLSTMEIAFWSTERWHVMDILPDGVMGWVPVSALGDLIIALQSGDESEMKRVACAATNTEVG